MCRPPPAAPCPTYGAECGLATRELAKEASRWGGADVNVKAAWETLSGDMHLKQEVASDPQLEAGQLVELLRRQVGMCRGSLVAYAVSTLVCWAMSRGSTVDFDFADIDRKVGDFDDSGATGASVGASESPQHSETTSIRPRERARHHLIPASASLCYRWLLDAAGS